MSEDDKASFVGQQLLDCGKARQNLAVAQAELQRIGTALETIGRKLKAPMPANGVPLTMDEDKILENLGRLKSLYYEVATNQQAVAKCNQLMRELHLID